MFGLTKREQRWAAEQKAVETLLNFAVEIAKANAAIRIAEAQKCPHCGSSATDSTLKDGSHD